jgi:RimJ/RimL family protein N-acetyltransferase
VLRGWREDDRTPFAVMNADPEVMRWSPRTLTAVESDRLADRFARAIEHDGYGAWALEERATGRFLGFTGLVRPSFDAHFTPAVEIGWRLARPAWGLGFATEAARAASAFAFGELGLDELVSFTSAENLRSRAVMERLGMRRTPPSARALPARARLASAPCNAT